MNFVSTAYDCCSISGFESADVKNQRPSYPSSKNKVEWDKLAAEVKKEVLPSFLYFIIRLEPQNT